MALAEQNRKTLVAFHQALIETTASRDAHADGGSSFFDLFRDYPPRAYDPANG